MFIEWQNNQAAKMRCTNKWSETQDTVSIQLEAADGTLLHFSGFKPGQFVSLGLEFNGKMEYRAYSIASMPGDNHLKLTIKRVDGGLMSNYIVDEFNVGDEVAVLSPTGPFNSIDCQPKQKVALLSAGCGITPVMSMVKTWLRDKANIDITFIHQAKNKAQTIYFEELEKLASEHDNFTLKLLLKDNSDTAHQQGRLDKEWLNALCPDLAERTVYLCGPTAFMSDMEANSLALGVEPSQFHQESFTPIEAHTEEAGGVVQFEVPAFGVKAEVSQGATLADVLEENGVPVIIACRSGMCGSCKCKVTKSEVTRSSIETLTEADIEAGYTLACSTQIQSDVEVSLN